MKRFEYRVLNASEAEGKLLDKLNELGSQGWEIVFAINSVSWLMKREVLTGGF